MPNFVLFDMVSAILWLMRTQCRLSSALYNAADTALSKNVACFNVLVGAEVASKQIQEGVATNSECGSGSRVNGAD